MLKEFWSRSCSRQINIYGTARLPFIATRSSFRAARLFLDQPGHLLEQSGCHLEQPVRLLEQPDYRLEQPDHLLEKSCSHLKQPGCLLEQPDCHFTRFEHHYHHCGHCSFVNHPRLCRRVGGLWGEEPWQQDGEIERKRSYWKCWCSRRWWQVWDSPPGACVPLGCSLSPEEGWKVHFHLGYDCSTTFTQRTERNTTGKTQEITNTQLEELT